MTSKTWPPGRAWQCAPGIAACRGWSLGTRGPGRPGGTLDSPSAPTVPKTQAQPCCSAAQTQSGRWTWVVIPARPNLQTAWSPGPASRPSAGGPHRRAPAGSPPSNGTCSLLRWSLALPGASTCSGTPAPRRLGGGRSPLSVPVAERPVATPRGPAPSRWPPPPSSPPPAPAPAQWPRRFGRPPSPAPGAYRGRGHSAWGCPGSAGGRAGATRIPPAPLSVKKCQGCAGDPPAPRVAHQ
mmetsp:Transcript_73651/g.168861  ORF Transcript_73651/g.168861 Transcript_73651/m.168861 type:complete len:239 (-) Transcript_73651:515-1231(-)